MVAIMKYHRLGGLNNRKELSHSPGGQKSGIKVSVALLSSADCEGGICSRPLSSWLVGGQLLHLFMLSFLYVCLCPNFTFCKDAGHTGLGPNRTTSFTLDYLFRGARVTQSVK